MVRKQADARVRSRLSSWIFSKFRESSVAIVSAVCLPLGFGFTSSQSMYCEVDYVETDGNVREKYLQAALTPTRKPNPKNVAIMLPNIDLKAHLIQPTKPKQKGTKITSEGIAKSLPPPLRSSSGKLGARATTEPSTADVGNLPAMTFDRKASLREQRDGNGFDDAREVEGLVQFPKSMGGKIFSRNTNDPITQNPLSNNTTPAPQNFNFNYEYPISYVILVDYAQQQQEHAAYQKAFYSGQVLSGSQNHPRIPAPYCRENRNSDPILEQWTKDAWIVGLVIGGLFLFTMGAAAGGSIWYLKRKLGPTKKKIPKQLSAPVQEFSIVGYAPSVRI